MLNTTVAMALASFMSCLPSASAQDPAAPSEEACRVQELVIDDDEALEELAARGCGQIVGNLTIRGSAVSSTNLEELSGLERIEGNLAISSVRSLRSLNGLKGLVEVTGDFKIIANESLEGLDGLEALSSVGGALIVAHHPRLASVSALGTLREVGKNLGLVGNPKLASLEGLEGLTRVGGILQLAYLTRLETLASLVKLESVGGLDVEGNQSLARFELPANLQVLEGKLRVVDNPRLATVGASTALSRIGGEIEFTHNGSLDRCEIDALLAGVERGADEEAVSLNDVDEECER